MAVRDPADEAVNVEEADADQESVVAAGCAGVWEVGQGAREVVVVGSLDGLTGRLDGVSDRFSSVLWHELVSGVRFADPSCGHVSEFDVHDSGPDERRIADVLRLWWLLEADKLRRALEIFDRRASIGARQWNALEILE